jgi:hypothetical protein
MRKKISTLLEEALFRRAKIEAIRQGKQFSEIVGEALEVYLRDRANAGAESGVVSESFGIMKTKPQIVRQVLREEDGLFDAG